MSPKNTHNLIGIYMYVLIKVVVLYKGITDLRMICLKAITNVPKNREKS